MASRKKLCAICCVVLIVVLVVVPVTVILALLPLTVIPRISDVYVYNEDGATGTAFVVYHPGISSFHQDVTLAFVNGLVNNDWRVDVTTASGQTPTNLTGYDLMVLGGPSYGNALCVPLADYVNRLGDFGGIDVALIITSGGNGTGAMDTLEAQVEAANGNVVLKLQLFNLYPNIDAYGNTNPIVIATQAAEDLPLP